MMNDDANVDAKCEQSKHGMRWVRDCVEDQVKTKKKHSPPPHLEFFGIFVNEHFQDLVHFDILNLAFSSSFWDKTIEL